MTGPRVMTRRAVRRGSSGLNVFATLALCLGSGSAEADALWVSRPYRVAIETTFAPNAGLSEAQQLRVRRALNDRIEQRLRPFWDTTSAGDGVAPTDKSFALKVDRSGSRFRVEAIETDGLLGQSEVAVSELSMTLAGVPEALYGALARAFRPVARFARDPSDPARVRLDYRASAMAPPRGVATCEAGDVLAPYLRRLTRTGEARPDGLRAAKWTYLVATESGGDSGPPIARVISHTRRPFAGATRGRVERLAIRLPRRDSPATLVLTDLDNPDTPLPGYEVLVGAPGSADVTIAGLTDVRGRVTLPAGGGVVMAHVRCGGLMVASLPVANGAGGEVIVPLLDERARLRGACTTSSGNSQPRLSPIPK